MTSTNTATQETTAVQTAWDRYWANEVSWEDAQQKLDADLAAITATSQPTA